MVDKAEVEKEQKLKAALDRVNALEQELTETKKVNSWYSWVQISKLACKIINPKEEKSRHFLFFSFFQALEEARVKQDELLASVGKEKKLVRLLNTYNLLGKLKFVFISVLFHVNIWPCSGFVLCRAYSVGEAIHINIYVVWWISGSSLSDSREGWSGNTVCLSVFGLPSNGRNYHFI